MTYDDLDDAGLNRAVAERLGWKCGEFYWSTGVHLAMGLLSAREHHWSISTMDNGYRCEVRKKNSDTLFDCVHKSLPRAICIAWLKATERGAK